MQSIKVYPIDSVYLILHSVFYSILYFYIYTSTVFNFRGVFNTRLCKSETINLSNVTYIAEKLLVHPEAFNDNHSLTL